MKKVRTSLFETNSSSVHTITIDKRGMEKPSLDIRRRKKDDGTFGKFIIGKLGTFGKDFRDYKTQDEKLSYLLTICYLTDGHLNLEDMTDSWAFKDLEREICEYCKCDGIKIDPKTEGLAYIDHQTMNDYSYMDDFRYSHMDYVDFVFNSYVSLHTDCD